MSHFVSGYLTTVFNPELQNLHVNKCCEIIARKFPDVEYIAVRGISGLIIGSIVANKLNKRLIVSRKEASIHSYNNNEGIPSSEGHEYIILDDFISTGDTVKTIMNGLGKMTLSGIVLYESTIGLTQMSEGPLYYKLKSIPIEEFSVSGLV